MYYYFLIFEDRIKGIEYVQAIFDKEAEVINAIKYASFFPQWELKTNVWGKYYAERFKFSTDANNTAHLLLRYKVVEMENGQCDDEPLFFKSYEEYAEQYL